MTKSCRALKEQRVKKEYKGRSLFNSRKSVMTIPLLLTKLLKKSPQIRGKDRTTRMMTTISTEMIVTTTTIKQSEAVESEWNLTSQSAAYLHEDG